VTVIRGGREIEVVLERRAWRRQVTVWPRTPVSRIDLGRALSMMLGGAVPPANAEKRRLRRQDGRWWLEVGDESRRELGVVEVPLGRTVVFEVISDRDLVMAIDPVRMRREVEAGVVAQMWCGFTEVGDFSILAVFDGGEPDVIATVRVIEDSGPEDGGRER
jgi:hypothetical protein